MAAIDNYLDRYFDPVTSVFTPELARKIVELKPAAKDAERIAELGEKADAGSLTDEEKLEYQEFVDAGDFIALLKAKARSFLASSSG
jgi:hypothetical protein